MDATRRAGVGYKSAPFALGLIGIGLVGCLDWLTGAEVSISIFYLLPISLAAWHGGRPLGIALSVVAAWVWLALDLAGGARYSHPLVPWWNALVRFGFFLLTTFLLSRLRSLTAHLQGLVAERTSALAAEVEQRRQAEREMALVSGREQERIARELHDGLGAFLCGVAFRAKAVAEALQRRGAPEGREAQEVVRLLNRASNQVRSFAHLLAPVDEGSGGLAMALARFGAEMETAFGITCLIEIEPSLPPLADEQARELYLIIQEAARNAVLHGHATEVEVLVTHRDGQVQAIVRNDGLAWPPPEEPSEGLGLRIMRYRAGLLGGQLGFEACPGGGCRLSCCIPIHGPSIETPSHAVLAEAALPA